MINSSDYWKKDIALQNIEASFVGCELFSFDIFDTLLFRTVKNPSDIFIEVGRHGVEQGIIRKEITPVQFKQIRMMAQRSIKKKKMESDFGEYTIHELYEEFPKNTGDIPSILKLEIEIEKDNNFLNHSIYSLIEHLSSLNKKVILTSDMYLNKEEIKEILKHNRFNFKLIYDIEVSCTYNKSKAQGNMYEHLMEKYRTPYEKVFHIGDNYISDYINAKKNDINAFHYNMYQNPNLKGIKYESIAYLDQLVPELYQIRILAGNSVAQLPESDRFNFIFGATILGPFFTFFAEWIIDNLEESKVKNVYPFMSEGVFFEKILQNAASLRNSDVSIKKMYISRASTFLAKIDEFNEEFLDELLLERRKFQVDSLLEQLAINDSTDLNIKEISRKVIGTLTDNEMLTLKAFLMEDTNQKYIKNNIEQRKEYLFKYLEDNFDFENFVTVDIGYRGSSATNLELFLRKKGYNELNITHLLAIATNQLSANLFKGVKFNSFIYPHNTESEFSIQTAFNYCQVIETIINNDVLSTINYKKVKDEIKPIFEEKYDDEISIKNKRTMQEGILYFQEMSNSHLKDKKSIIKKIKEKPLEMLQMINRVFELPTYEEANKLGSLFHKNGYFDTNRIQFIEKELLDEYSVNELLDYGNAFDKIYWKNGFITLKDQQILLRNRLNENNKYIKNPNYLNTVNLVDVVLAKNINEVSIYGSGEAGQMIASLLALFDIKVSTFIDSNPSLHGLLIEDTIIISLEEALARDEKDFIIGSFSFIDEIKNIIIKKSKELGIKVNIIY